MWNIHMLTCSYLYSPSAHVYNYIPRMCTMHISVLTYHRNVHVSYACVSRARMYLSCTIPHSFTVLKGHTLQFWLELLHILNKRDQNRG